ncbi:Antizyme inhibitor 1 [Boothiomyces sp. JEL0838]|nr:Antizyme inhibitor 1 [Boothiomyces sp. JEL0838]
MKETYNALINTQEFASQIHPQLKLVSKPSTEFVPQVLNRSIASILKTGVTKRDIEEEDPFFVCDLGEVARQHAQWKRLLPRVQPFYAVKCNPDPVILKVLAKCGTGFDCASKAEIQLALNAGVDSSRIIYANPCKQASHIKFASSKNVNVMTFDNADELYKIKMVAPESQLVLRILTDDSKSVCRFGVKFGASLSIVPYLLETAKSLNLDVIGISFHVGSGCFDATSFTDAVELARKAFDIGEALGFNFTLLDIGGGFPGNNPEGLQFKDIAALLGPAIDRLFPPHIRVISEPGRYFVSSAFTLAVNIQARRVVSLDAEGNPTDPTHDENPSFMYYINDGMYGSFNCITFDHAVVKMKPLCRSGTFMYEQEHSLKLFESSVWGPTCDSIDLIGRNIFLPEMKIGDWLSCSHMGAYTIAAASTFNGFKKSNVIYTDTN